MEPPLEKGIKVYIIGPGHRTKVAATPIYGKKTFKNFRFHNRKSYDLETWHAASVTQTLQNLIQMNTLVCVQPTFKFHLYIFYRFRYRREKLP